MHCSFTKGLTAEDINFLTSWKQGGTITADWRIEGYAILNTDRFRNTISNTGFLIVVNSLEPYFIASEAFLSDFLEPAGFRENFVCVMPLQIPGSVHTPAKNPSLTVALLLPALIMFKEYLQGGVLSI